MSKGLKILGSQDKIANHVYQSFFCFSFLKNVILRTDSVFLTIVILCLQFYGKTELQ